MAGKIKGNTGKGKRGNEEKGAKRKGDKGNTYAAVIDRP